MRRKPGARGQRLQKTRAETGQLTELGPKTEPDQRTEPFQKTKTWTMRNEGIISHIIT